MKKFIKTNKAPEAVGPYSQAIEAGDFIFVAGQLPIDPQTGELNTGDIKSQTRQVIKNLQGILEEASLTLDDAVNVQVFMTDLSNFGAMNEVYNEFFGESLPARAAVQVAALPKGADVEMALIAYRK